MNRGKKIVILSHCIINQNSVVKPYAKNGKDFLPFITWCLSNNIGIIQLPCPETGILGLRRWGHVKDQFENSNFLNSSIKYLEPFIDIIQDYLKEEYQILGIFGIKGSPSCGISKTCRADWCGEASSYESINDISSRVKMVDEKGIFMEKFEELLKQKNISIPFIDIDDWRIEND